MGTSLELRLVGRLRGARPPGRGPGAPRDRPPLGHLQQLRPGERVQPMDGRAQDAGPDRARAVRGPPALRPMADGQRGRVRSEGRGADAALVALRQGGPDADARGDRRGQGRDEPARLAARPGRDDRRAALRLSRSASTRSPRATSSSGPATPRWTEGGIRGVLLNVGGDLRVCGAIDRTIGIADPRADSESSEPLAYLAVRDKAVSTSGRLAARVPDRRPLVLAQARPRDRAGRSSGSPARRSSPIGRPTPTPSPRSSTCSRPRRASAWPGRSRASSA